MLSTEYTKLDKGFMPMALVCREMRENTVENGQDLIVAVERNQGYTYVYRTRKNFSIEHACLHTPILQIL